MLRLQFFEQPISSLALLMLHIICFINMYVCMSCHAILTSSQSLYTGESLDTCSHVQFYELKVQSFLVTILDSVLFGYLYLYGQHYVFDIPLRLVTNTTPPRNGHHQH